MARASPKRKEPADEATAKIRDMMRSHVPDAIAELARLAGEAKSETARVSAISALIDRAYGRLKETTEGDDGQHGITVRFVAPPETT